MMKSTFPGFSLDALAFLRKLKRNNKREWFQPRKEQFETLIKLPMLELVACMNQELARFATGYVTPPQKAVYRIYRDTRFSPNKTPYKTHIAAIFPKHTAVKREGAVFYMHFTPDELLVFSGVYSPERDELLAYRTLIQEHYQELEEILREKKLRQLSGGLQGEELSRMPKGFPVDHPAEALLRKKQWYLECVLDVKVVTSPRLVPEIVRHFQAMTPFVEFMNRAFARKHQPKKMPFMAF
ncbi:MAG TPA: DUF2461 domain-containing protein [Candidatus Angelobacter sp.]|nr:DUF2461 domain-containing protein [Candidatus Angelobacter sp.]